MNSVDVLLINPPTNRQYKKDMTSMPPLGQLYIAAHLKKEGFSCEFVDLAVDFYSKNEFIELLLDKRPKIVGLATYAESWSTVHILSDLIKKYLPDTVQVAGGAFASFAYEKILSTSHVSFVIVGEGEFTFAELSSCILSNTCTIEDVNGIVFIKNGNIISTEKRERIKDLDLLEYPDRSLIKKENYLYPITISTSRGCPGDCIFCSSRAFWGHKVIFRSVLSILEEIRQATRDMGLNMFFIVDDTFTANKKRAIEFCELLSKEPERYYWGCESRADVVDECLIQKLSNAGCKKIQFGMESSDNTILKQIGKKVTFEQIENAVQVAQKYKFDINISFIIGHPFDTKETVEKTMRDALYLRKKYGVNLFCSVLTPFPGTPIHDRAKEYGIKILSDDYDKYTLDNVIINTNYLTSNEIREYYQYFINAMRKEK